MVREVKEMQITIGGVPGAGKTTVARILSKKLGYKYYYMGSIMRKMAGEKGMNIEEFYAKHGDGVVDKMVDDHQSKIGMDEDDFVMEGRTSFHFIPNSFKIYFNVNLDTAAQRIFSDRLRKNEKKHGSVDETLESVRRRIETEKVRYPELYGFDCHDHKYYDLVVDTTNLGINEVLSIIFKEIRGWNRRV